MTNGKNAGQGEGQVSREQAITACNKCDQNGYFLTPCRKWDSTKKICSINLEGTCGDLCDKQGNKKQACPHN